MPKITPTTVAAHGSGLGMVQHWPAGFTAQLPTDDWVIAHTLPRQEKRLAADLHHCRVPGLLFLERRVRRYPGKGTQESLVPLLGGYVFAHLPRGQHHLLYDTQRIVRLINVSQPEVLADDLRALIRLVEATTAPLIVRPELTPGTRTIITRGVFTGCLGIVVRRQRTLELLVNLELLGTSVAVTLPAEFAERQEII